MRDHVLGVRFVNGAGEVLRSGGRVLKNVTGLDLCKLLAGSYGTLGVMTEVTIKVLPAPEATATLLLRVPDLATGVRALSAGLGSPFGVSGAALLPGEPHMAALRLEDFATSVAYRTGRLRDDLAGFGDAVIIEGEASRAFWRDLRDVVPLAAQPDEAVWRVSVRPSAGPAVALAAQALGGRALLDWGGGLVWVAAAASTAAHDALVAAAAVSGGTCTLFRGPEALRLAVPVLPAEPPPLAAIGARVKAALDPAGILNPGRMRAGL
jgi:glycolate oxidase FAD binding subunit